VGPEFVLSAEDAGYILVLP